MTTVCLILFAVLVIVAIGFMLYVMFDDPFTCFLYLVCGVPQTMFKLLALTVGAIIEAVAGESGG